LYTQYGGYLDIENSAINVFYQCIKPESWSNIDETFYKVEMPNVSSDEESLTTDDYVSNTQADFDFTDYDIAVDVSLQEEVNK
jgi:hypothetical protein